VALVLPGPAIQLARPAGPDASPPGLSLGSLPRLICGPPLRFPTGRKISQALEGRIETYDLHQ
jgi:hypothetical protein